MLEFLYFFLAVTRRRWWCQGERREEAGAISPANTPFAVGRFRRELESPVTLWTVGIGRQLRRACSRVVLEHGLRIAEAHCHLVVVEPGAPLMEKEYVANVEAVAQDPTQLALLLELLVQRRRR
jgi:hypothetical protein